MPNFAGAISAMNGVVGKAVELAGEYKGLLKNEGGLNQAKRKAVNEMSNNHVKNMTEQARNIVKGNPGGNQKNAFEAIMGGQALKTKKVADQFSSDARMVDKHFDPYNAARIKKYAAGTLGHDNISQQSFNRAIMKKEVEAGARTVKNATQDYFLDPLKAFKNSTGEAKSLAGKQAAARIGTAAVGLGAAGAVATNEL